jgi:hypothetical protein
LIRKAVVGCHVDFLPYFVAGCPKLSERLRTSLQATVNDFIATECSAFHHRQSGPHMLIHVVTSLVKIVFGVVIENERSIGFLTFVPDARERLEQAP